MKETMCLVFGSHLGTPYICLFPTNLQCYAIVTSLPENFTSLALDMDKYRSLVQFAIVILDVIFLSLYSRVGWPLCCMLVLNLLVLLHCKRISPGWISCGCGLVQGLKSVEYH